MAYVNENRCCSYMNYKSWIYADSLCITLRIFSTTQKYHSTPRFVHPFDTVQKWTQFTWLYANNTKIPLYKPLPIVDLQNFLKEMRICSYEIAFQFSTSWFGIFKQHLLTNIHVSPTGWVRQAATENRTNLYNLQQWNSTQIINKSKKNAKNSFGSYYSESLFWERSPVVCKLPRSSVHCNVIIVFKTVFK